MISTVFALIFSHWFHLWNTSFSLVCKRTFSKVCHSVSDICGIYMVEFRAVSIPSVFSSFGHRTSIHPFFLAPPCGSRLGSGFILIQCRLLHTYVFFRSVKELVVCLGSSSWKDDQNLIRGLNLERTAMSTASSEIFFTFIDYFLNLLRWLFSDSRGISFPSVHN